MPLTLYNTLTRGKVAFQPLDPQNVRMYVCGPTVYDLAHIGNARPIIVFDVLFRVLRYAYGAEHVTYARNITDVDDKINARAVERFAELPPIEAIGRLTRETTEQFHRDIAALGVLPPTIEPRATDHIAEMRALCEALVKNGHAYVGADHVLFDVSSMPDYGKLANRSLDEMEAGARVEIAPYKKGPMDFVLWKPSKAGEPAWPSPCGIAGEGRPGWHLECSAMAGKHLGEVFDIHGGGIDLVFPHHENEIAQSRCAHGTPVMANVWMHNGHLQAEGEKMSKSLGNFVAIKALVADNPGDAVRLAMLATHYRQPLSWSDKALLEARRTLDGWYELTAEAGEGGPVCADVLEALEDDLNTPRAIAALHALRHEAAKGHAGAKACLKSSARMMGLLQGTAAGWKAWRPASLELDEAKVAALIAARLDARKARDFKESDRIRDELAQMGIAIKDNKDGTTTWEIRR